MKKVAVVIYEGFCMFEFSVALEALAMSAQCEVDIFGEEKSAYRSEEGLLCLAEHTFDELNVVKYDGIILTGFQNENPSLVNNKLFLEKIREFNSAKKVIAAISAAPIFLVKADILGDKSFMCGCPKEGLLEEGFTQEQLKNMIDWEECIKSYDILKFIRQDNIITSVAYGFREWAMETVKMLGIQTYPRSFGL